MICPNCHTHNPAGAKYCVNCGYSLPESCPHCGVETPVAARFCLNCGSPLARPPLNPVPAAHDPDPAADLDSSLEALNRRARVVGERRVVTALFCDVTGSTAMAEQLDPEDWVMIMNGAFGHLIRPVYRYEGTVARLMGDAILAFFGAPVAHEDDPERAVLAGLEMLSTIKPYCERIRQRFGLDFNVRVGINTGPVVVGEVGSELAMEYTAMGDAVNVAARIEETAAPGTVQISETTYRRVARLFEVEPLGPIQVKGKRTPIPVYRVLGRRSDIRLVRGGEGRRAPLVGRDAERARLSAIIGEVLQGRGQIVFLVGEAGLGKSRLIEETRQEWERQGGRRGDWSDSRGLAYDSAHPYGMFVQRLYQYFGVLPDDTPAVIREKVAQGAVNMPSGQGTLVTHAVEMLLAADGTSDEPQPEGEVVRRQLADTAVKLWRALGKNAPGVSVFDDLHWADSASVDLLIHLFQVVENSPILFLCAMRPYHDSLAWQAKEIAARRYPDRYTEISLGPLSDDDSRALVDSLLENADEAASLRELILSKAEGNPFFVEEVVRALVDEGTVVQDEASGRWQVVASVDDIVIPDSLRGLLMARIDRLEEETRRTLQLAAVIGRSFHYRVLERISGAAGRLDEQIRLLEQSDLIQEAARTPELEYMFRHEMTREAAYHSILRIERRRFHQRVGEAVEELFANRLEDEADRLAYHFEQAGDDARALDYYTMAGNRAARLYANTEAAAHYTRALVLARQLDVPGDHLAHLYGRRGRMYELNGRYDEALANYRELEALGVERDDPAMVLAALIPQATVHVVPTMRFDANEGRALSERALALARELEDHGAESEALWNMMLLDYFTGNINRSLEYGEQALSIARQHQLQRQEAYALHDLARAYMAAGRTEEAWEAEMKAYNAWRELGNIPMLADSLGSLADGAFLVGDLDAALKYAEEGVRLSRSISNYWGESYNLGTLGTLHVERGNVSEGMQMIRDSMLLAEQANFLAVDASASAILSFFYSQFGDMASAFRIARPLLNEKGQSTLFPQLGELVHGLLYAAAGDFDRAAEYLDGTTFDSLPVESMSVYSAIIADNLAALAADRGNYDEALSITGRMIDHMRKMGQRIFLPDLLHRQGKLLLALERLNDAHEALLQARAEAETMRSRRSLWSILLSLADVEEQLGDSEAAEACRAEARDVVDYLADHMDDPALHAAFLALPRVDALMGTKPTFKRR